MQHPEIINTVTKYLHEVFGDKASFRKDQCEAIISTITNRLTLVVEKTGWGKSLVYILATRYFRNSGYAPTIIISPLISLMRNQLATANKLGLNCCLINYQQELGEIRPNIANDRYDMIFITPEQMKKDEVKSILIRDIRKEFALFVVDEAHCISEWGHDFRPDYCQLKDYINNYLNNPKLHVLATTATANDFVINDLKNQFYLYKDSFQIIRGELLRESHYIEIIKDLTIAQKFVWILKFLKNHQGSGIIYSMTIRDADLLAHYLRINHINALSYHSKIENREQIENDFLYNRIQVLVATSALGMGYDKPDVTFVIHFQCPISMLEYYQQIGRAGRNVDEARIVLLSSKTDDKLANYFIENSFPDPRIMTKILDYIGNQNSLKKTDLLNVFNIKSSNLEAILKHLQARKLINKDKSYYYRTTIRSNLNEYIDEKKQIIEIKKQQFERMKEFINHKDCLMKFISEELNDPYAHTCGKCSNCTGQHTVINLDPQSIEDATIYINKPYRYDISLSVITPRKQYPNLKKLPFVNNQGYFLAKYLFGLGETVRHDKYELGEFSSILVQAMTDMIVYLATNDLIEKQNLVITCVPSIKRPNLVRNFAIRVASALRIQFVDSLIKVKDNQQQKAMLNSARQYSNVESAFAVKQNSTQFITNRNILLIDDMVDSKWTFTHCGLILQRDAHASSVTPLALADTSSE
ncbi:MAG: RecQ family ATP-dependent DNA helicase [Succinivibrionaceae bacterium]|nr:RecQ family ATP-dependent DNA helicase [Succinivibrionaceae bacterium]